MTTEEFQTWEPRQDQAALWGTLDEAAREHIREHFKFREICDPVKMFTFFSRDIHDYTDHYYAMYRLQQANSTMQPHINRYGEFLKISKAAGSTTKTVQGSSSKGTKTSGTKSRTEKWDGRTEGSDIQTVNGTNSRSGSETIKDSRTGGSTKSISRSEIEAPYSDSTQTTGAETTTYNKERETLTFADRTTNKTVNGKKREHVTGDASKNYEKDASGSTETTTHKVNTRSSTQQLGAKVTTEDSKQSTKAKAADKAAPMTAIGITRSEAAGKDSYDVVKAGSISGLNFEYASAYGEKAGETGSTGTRREYYEGDDNIIQRQGDSADNQDQTTYARNVQRNQDVTTETSYDNYGEQVKESGSQAKEMTGGHKVDKSGSETRSVGKRDKTVTESDTGTENETISGDHRSSSSGTETKNANNVMDRSTTDEGVISENDGRQEDVTGSSSSTETGNTDSDMRTTNRYTGREGLTPQDALDGALKYLRSNPPCIVWLCEMLEHNFIQVYDI